MILTSASTGHFRRFAYTIELRSATQAATVTLNGLADARNAMDRRCAGNGTAVLTG